MQETIHQLKEKGKTLIHQEKYNEAIEIFKRVIIKIPTDIYSLDVLGFLHYMTGNFEAAKKNCEESIKQKPDNYYAYKGLGLCLVRLGRIEEGIENLKRSIEINPSYFDSYYDLAITYLEIMKFDLARTYFEKALHIDAGRKKDIDKAINYMNSLMKNK